MTILEIVLIIVLLVSVIANYLAFWYMRRILPGFIYTSQNLQDLTALVANYQKHLKNIYDMEMYYGDETIKHLMSHTTSLMEILEDYEDIYSITMPFEEIDDDQEQDLKGEQPDGETEKNQENVFYAGSRRRDS
jgi:hypothetical protein